jgi:hypothetical protein
MLKTAINNLLTDMANTVQREEKWIEKTGKDSQ